MAASCTIEELPNEVDPTKFDKSLGDILINGYDGDSTRFLSTVLGFLKRKSNFFKEPVEAKKKLLVAFQEVSVHDAEDLRQVIWKSGLSVHPGKKT